MGEEQSIRNSIEMKDTDGRTIEVHLHLSSDRQVLDFFTDGPLVIVPMASNRIRVITLGRGRLQDQLGSAITGV